MRCVMCHQHATFDRTVFKGTQPVKVRLCDTCAQKVQANDHMARIKAAPDHDAKTDAISAFLDAVGQ